MLTFKSSDIPLEDYSKYYTGSVVRVHEKNKEPRWLDFSAAKDGALYFTDDKGKAVVIKRSEVVLEQVFPVGFFNTKDSVVFGQRIPVRQVIKGINRQNYSLRPIEKILKDVGLLQTSNIKLQTAFTYLDQRNARSLIYCSTLFNNLMENPRYFSVSQAYVAIKGKKAFGRALSPEFALVPHPHTKDFLIFRNENPVAELVSKTKVRILMEEFRQECIDFFDNGSVSVI